MDPFGWRIAAAVVGSLMVLVMCPAGPPAHRLDPARRGGGPAAVLRRPALRALAASPCWTSSWRSSSCSPCTATWPTATGTAPGSPASLDRDGGHVTAGTGPRPRPALAALAGRGRCQLGAGVRHQVGGGLPARGLRAADVSSGAPVPGAPSASAGRCCSSALADGIPAFVSVVLVGVIVYVATWTGWLMHAQPVREGPVLDAVHAVHRPGPLRRQVVRLRQPRQQGALADRHRARRQRPRRGRPVAAVALVLPPGRLHVPHPLPELLHPHLRLEAVGLAAAQPPGRRRRRHRRSSPARRAATPRGQRLPAGDQLLGTPALWWGGCLAVLVAAALWVGARDWRYGVAVVGTLSTWLPWLQYDDRPIFTFYAIITIPFLVLADHAADGPDARRLVGTRPRAAPPG